MKKAFLKFIRDYLFSYYGKEIIKMDEATLTVHRDVMLEAVEHCQEAGIPLVIELNPLTAMNMCRLLPGEDYKEGEVKSPLSLVKEEESNNDD